MFNSKLNDINFFDSRNVPIIISNINNPIIKERIDDLGVDYAFRKFINNELYLVIKNCDDDNIKKEVIKILMIKSVGQDHFNFLSKLSEGISNFDELIKENLGVILYSNMEDLKSNKSEYNILSFINQNLIYEFPGILKYPIIINDIYACIDDKPRFTKYICDNIVYIINSCKDVEELFNFFNKSEFLRNNINVLNDNIDLIISKLLRIDIEQLKSENLDLFYRLLVEDILKHENITLADIEYHNNGAHCYAYKFGNILVKFGTGENNKKVPKHPRIMLPIIRKKVSNNRYIDIQYFAEEKKFSLEQIYMIFKDLRDDGIVWIDCKAQNMGILLRDNDNSYKELEPTDESIGFDNRYNGCKTAKKGDIAIFDYGCIYYEDDIDWNEVKKLNIDLSIYNYCESRYQNEIAKKDRKSK